MLYYIVLVICYIYYCLFIGPPMGSIATKGASIHKATKGNHERTVCPHDYLTINTSANILYASNRYTPNQDTYIDEVLNESVHCS